jgi:hypothetical protein
MSSERKIWCNRHGEFVTGICKYCEAMETKKDLKPVKLKEEKTLAEKYQEAAVALIRKTYSTQSEKYMKEELKLLNNLLKLNNIDARKILEEEDCYPELLDS